MFFNIWKFLSFLLITYNLFSLSSTQQITFDDLDVTLRDELEAAFENSRNRALIGSVTRLIFHDCAGQQESNFNGFGGSICDGCIGFENHDNAGLQSLAVEPLESIYSGPNNWSGRGLSRADFWAASATIAIQYAQELDNSNDILPNIPFYIGRTDCSGSPDEAVTATNYLLPYKSLPNAKGGWTENLSWFETNFGFDITETVAIIGAHTLGRMHSGFSGYGSTRGTPWVGSSDQLNNDFYRNLIRRVWEQRLNNQGLYEWVDTGNANRIFLNSDITLFKDIDDNIVDTDNGEVSCTFSTCPTNDAAISIVQLFANNNQEWLNDFANAWNKMIQIGYNNLQILTDDIVPDPNPIPDPITTSTPPPIFTPPSSISAPSAPPTPKPRGKGGKP